MQVGGIEDGSVLQKSFCCCAADFLLPKTIPAQQQTALLISTVVIQDRDSSALVQVGLSLDPGWPPSSAPLAHCAGQLERMVEAKQKPSAEAHMGMACCEGF